MAKRSNKMTWIIAAGVVVLLGVLVHSTLQATHAEYEVCMTFKGGSHCANATGANYNEAVRSAEEIDCQLLARGRDETMVCLDTQPSSVHQVQK
jgi:hypothetical protein